MAITLAQICDAVADTIAEATTLTHVHSYDELKEGMPDTPTVEVYPQSINQDPSTAGTDRTSFQAGVRQTDVTIHADLYAARRSHLGENMATLLPLVDAVVTRLEAQNTKPYFGLVGLKAFTWSGERVVFERSEPREQYAGWRFIIRFRVF